MGNDYAEDMVSGNVVLAMAWSGDIVIKQAEKETLVWHLPDEGGMLWTDNMLIPKGAQHKYTAELMIDFVYDPAIAAQIAAYVNYVTPVKGAKEELAKTDPDMAEQPADLPARRGPLEGQDLQGPDRGRGDVLQRQVLDPPRRLTLRAGR